MILPTPAYLAIAAFAGALLLAGVVSFLAGLANWAAFFAWRGTRRLDAKMGRRGARVFCIAVGGVVAFLGLCLLLAALLPMLPRRRLRLLEPPSSAQPVEKKMKKSVSPPNDSKRNLR